MRTVTAVSVAAGDQSIEGLPGPVLEARRARRRMRRHAAQWRLRTTGPWCADHVTNRLFVARVRTRQRRREAGSAAAARDEHGRQRSSTFS
jgi:hypothetical protein